MGVFKKYWRGGRVVDCGGLENRCTARYPGFESLSLRKPSVYCRADKIFGEMPEWSIGPHSKCGERVTVPRVRIPVSPLKDNEL